MPIRVLKKDKAKHQTAMAQKETPEPQNLNSKGSEQANEPTSPSALRDERKAQQREQRIQLKEYGMKKGGLSEKQKKIAAKAPPPDKITGADFAVLKKEKAKGRGMGLQDESIKPGKVMKASMGEAVDYKKYLAGLKKATSEVRKEKMQNFNKKFFKTIGVFPKISKKMGGGMMNKPMGYKSGTMVKARGCKLGRNKPTKLY